MYVIVDVYEIKVVKKIHDAICDFHTIDVAITFYATENNFWFVFVI